jgi:NADPH-dependent 2,4-dienoyl-CoA reductase/sulfur reductase-like enzyme
MALRRRGVTIMRRAAIVEVVGTERATEVVVAMLDRDWRPRRRGRARLPVDVVGMSYGLRANTELTQLLECEHVHEPAAGGWKAKRNADLATSVADVYAIGDGAGIGGADTALAEGVLLARHLAQRFGAGDRAALEARAAAAARRLSWLTAFRRALTDWSGLRPGIFTAADARTIVCRCEDVTGADLDAALAAGLTLPRGLKMGTRAGMGLCQGRTCTPAVQHRIARHAGIAVAEVPLPTVRVPVRPTPAGALATLAPRG